MEQLPKIVSQRLQAVSRTETHPDANLLAGFAEKSLLPREQTQILEHLAGCAVCREVVAQAQPEVLQSIAVAAVAPKAAHGGSWFQGAALRWVAMAACVVIVGAVVISRMQFSPHMQLKRAAVPVASNTEPAVVAKTETQPARGVPAPEESNEKQSERDYGRLKDAISAGRKRDQDTDELSKLGKEGPKRIANALPNEREQTNKPALSLETKGSATAVADSVDGNREVAASAVVLQQQEDAKASKKEFSADKAMKAPASTTEQVAVQAQAEAAMPAVPAAQPAPVVEEKQKTRSESREVNSLYAAKDGYVGGGGAVGGLMRSATPRWQLSPEGKLIKSSDLGKSWQTIPVADKVVLRALCVTGQEIWVGGAQGNLFYSSDAGQQWEQVKPTANGQALTADIATIEFKDPQHGKLTTSNHQTWITTDGGHAWQVETR